VSLNTTEQDVLLGDAFLWSVYMLNRFVDSIRGGPAPPYVQLLSTVDVAEAHAEFVQICTAGASVAAASALPIATEGGPAGMDAAGASATGLVGSTGTHTDSLPFPAATGSPFGLTAIGPSSVASTTNSLTIIATSCAVAADPMAYVSATSVLPPAADSENFFSAAESSAAPLDSMTMNLSGPAPTESSDIVAASATDAADVPISTDPADVGAGVVAGAAIPAVIHRSWRSRR
jgi:hypothetical protein